MSRAAGMKPSVRQGRKVLIGVPAPKLCSSRASLGGAQKPGEPPEAPLGGDPLPSPPQGQPCAGLQGVMGSLRRQANVGVLPCETCPSP